VNVRYIGTLLNLQQSSVKRTLLQACEKSREIKWGEPQKDLITRKGGKGETCSTQPSVGKIHNMDIAEASQLDIIMQLNNVQKTSKLRGLPTGPP
jgi:hypothetical protein